MNYKQEQTSNIKRRRSGITAHKILAIKGNNLTIRKNLKEPNTMDFSVLDARHYKAGEYVDMVIIKTGDHSSTTKLIGHTPPEFVPDNGVDIV